MKMITIGKGLLGSLIVLLILSTSLNQAFAQTNDLQPAVRLDGAADPAVVQAGEVVKVKLSLVKNGTTCPKVVTRRPLDVLVVMDLSTSMDEDLGGKFTGTKLEGAVLASKEFVGNMDQQNDRAGVVAFSNTAVVHAPIGQVDEANNQLSMLPGSLARGGTNIEAGLAQAIESLTQNSRQDASGVIVLLTDGNESKGSALSLKDTLLAKKVRVVTIGLGPEIDETLLRELAFRPADYYYAPDPSDLAAIYKSIAISIVESDPVTEVSLRYTYDASNFELISGSVVPPADIEVNTLHWNFPRIERDSQDLEFSLLAKVPGTFNAALASELDYLVCNEQPINVTPVISSGIEVTDTSPVSNVACGELPSQTGGQLDSFCSIPWGGVAGLLLGLFLFLFWLLRHKVQIRRWVYCSEPLGACSWTKLLVYLLWAVLAGSIVSQLTPLFCATRQGLLFWRISPELTSSLYLKSITPDLQPHKIDPLSGTDSCIGCHSASVEGGLITAITNGTNGRLIQFDFQGNPLSIPDLQGAYPSFSPDGKYLVYAANNEDIFLYDVQNRTSQAIPGASEPGIIETMPAWSADGSRIAFVRATGKNQNSTITVPSDIMTISIEGGNPLMVPGASGLGFNYHPVFSPDGKWLAFTHHESGTTTYGDPKAEIFVVPSQGGTARRLQANDGPGGQSLENAGNTWPSWSQDSKHIYFSSRRCDNQSDIYTAQIDDTGNSSPATRLMSISDPKSFEYHVQELNFSPVSPKKIFWALLPWIIPLLVLTLLNWWFCNRSRKRASVQSIEVNLLDPTPQKGWMRPDQKFTVQVEMLGRPVCDRRSLQRQVDAVLLLDTSASMAKKIGIFDTRMGAVKKAATRFVRCAINPRERIGVISFSDDVSVEQGLIDREEDIIQAIKRLEPSGNTAMKKGLEKAIEILLQQGRKNTAKVIVLLSDGDPTDSESEVIAMAKSAHDKGIRIVAVGTGDARPDLLQQLVISPEDYRFASDGKKLSETFREIALQLITPISATDIRFEHTYDQENFSLVPDSIDPSASVAGGSITWEISELDTAPIYFTYTVRPKNHGVFKISTGGSVSYKACGEGPNRTLELKPGADVEIKELEIADDIPLRDLPPAVRITHPTPAWQPDKALFIGIGDSGHWVLTHLLTNLFNAGNGRIPVDQDGNEFIQFLLCDTNEHENMRDTSFAGVNIPTSDTFILDENLTRIFADQKTLGPEASSWINPDDYANLQAQLNLAGGTSGKRSLARLGFIRNINSNADIQSHWREKQSQKGLATSFESMLKDRCVKVIGTVPNRRIRVFIIGSLAGGLSGLTNDIAALTRKVGKSLVGDTGEVLIEGYVIDGAAYANLPGGPQAGDDRQANSFASLRDLSKFQLNPGVAFPIGWQDYKVKSALFDDLLVFTQTYRPELVKEQGSSDVNFVAQKILRNYVFPSIADLLFVRLDRKTGAAGPNDWFNQMRTHRATRQNNEHLMSIGSAGIFSIRLPAQDILRSLHVRWAYELLHMFLTGQYHIPVETGDQDSGIPLIFEYSDALIGSDIYNQDPEQMVKRWLQGGHFGGDGTSSTLALLAHWTGSVDTININAVINDLGRSDEDLFKEQFKRLGKAVQVILVGSMHGSRTSRLAYAQLFLNKLKEQLLLLKQDLEAKKVHPANLVLFADICVNAAQKQSEDLDQLCKLISQNEPGLPTGIWERMSVMARKMQNLEFELDAITCRKYLWGEVEIVPGGINRTNRFADKWWNEYFSGRLEDYLDCLTWVVGIDGKIDLQVRISGEPYQLLLDGPGAILSALVQIASTLSIDASSTIRFDRILESSGILTPSLASSIGDLSKPITSQIRDAGVASDTLVEVTHDSNIHVLNHAPQFRENITRTALDQIAINNAVYPSSEPFWVAFMHLRNGTIYEHWDVYNQTKMAFDQADGYVSSRQSFMRPPFSRQTSKGGALARSLETSRFFNYQAAGILHPFVELALEFPFLAELFCLALSEGLIISDIYGRINLKIDNKEMMLSQANRNRIDPYVDALLTWCYKNDTSIEPDQWKFWTTFLEDRYTNKHFDPNPMVAWVQNLPDNFLTGQPDRKSLGFLTNGVLRHFSDTNNFLWKHLHK